MTSYCGKFFKILGPGHDGNCGPNNGPQCDECDAKQKKFSKMTADEQQELINKIASALNDNGLGDTDISIATEQVCNLTAKSVEKNVSLMVKKDLPASQSDKAEKFNLAVKPLIEGIAGCNVKVASKLGAGDPYKTIQNLMPIKGEEKIDLTHKEGEVWLVDFWATWCPPC